MTDPESILQLGIEAAKEGNTDEARSLFRLLTREQPDNPRGWLWLAGVAESREERQLALERVVELEPDNQLARQSLKAMEGPRPTTRLPDDELFGEQPPAVVAPPTTPVAIPVKPPNRTPPPDEDMFADDPFAELDNLSAVFSEAPEAVRREEPVVAPVAVPPATPPGHGERPREEAPTPKGSRRATAPRSQPAGTKKEYGSPMVKQSKGSSNWLPILVGAVVILSLIAIALVVVFDLPTRLRGGGRSTAGGGAPAVATGTPSVAAGGSIGLTPTSETVGGGGGGTEFPTAGVNQEPPIPEGQPPAPEGQPPTPEGQPSAPETPPSPEAQPPAPAPESPAPAPAPAPAGDLGTANPAVVPANTPLEANGWLYDFNSPGFATYIVGNIGTVPSLQGRYVVVLTFVANRSGQTQALPYDFFVLKDAQGRLYSPNPQASTAYVNLYGGRGVAADVSHEDAIPADGLTRSVPILFDVPAGATDLVFFSRYKLDQGWLVLQGLP